MKVLVAEDLSVVRMMIALEVAELGWASIEAASVADALRCWRSGGIDAAIVDIGLPDGSGADLVACLREDRPDLPIVVHTAYRELDPVVSQLPTDVTVVCKPARRGAIADALRAVMTSQVSS